MILIDANALILLIVGLIDTRLIKTHSSMSMYEEQDFRDLMVKIGKFEKLVILPNVWTEVDNILNHFSGNYKYPYIQTVTDLIKITTEKYIPSKEATQCDWFFTLGLTDSLLLLHAKDCELLITADSKLSDYANANGIRVYDMVQRRNKRI